MHPMPALCVLLLWLLLLLLQALLCSHSASAFDVSAYDELWTDSSDRETQSMPLGNGDLTLMLWLERNSSDLLYYAQSAAAYEENGQLLKLIRGRLHIRAAANSSTAALPPSAVRHRLHLLNASQTLEYDVGSVHVSVLVWVDRWRQAAHFHVSTSAPVQAVNAVEMWRTQPTTQDWWTWGYWCDNNKTVDPDVLYTGSGMGGGAGELLWYHRNDQQPAANLSYDWSLRHQWLDGIGLEALNPLRNRTFAGFITHHDQAGKLWSRVVVAPAAFGLTGSVSSQAPLQRLSFDLFTLTAQTPSLSSFMQRFQADVTAMARVPLAEALEAHRAFWSEFHNRSHIAVRVTDARVPDRVAVTFNLTRDLLLQRTVDAMNGFSDYPIHFNGQGYNIGTYDGTPQGPDYRQWGSAFWWQNVRESYYPAVQAGDYDLLRAMFGFYQRLLRVQEMRVRRYYGHDGGYYEETTSLSGLMVDGVFGYLCDGTVFKHGNPTIRLHWDGSLELCLLMVDTFRQTQDAQLLRSTLLPVCSSILTFFRQHYTDRDASNKTVFFPSQALETWQCADPGDPANCMTNSVVFISGLQAALQAMLSLPAELIPASLRAVWSEQLSALPPLPTGPCPAAPSRTCLLPGSRFVNQTGNSENVELYAVWPYRRFGVGIKDSDINIALANYATRPFPCNDGWCQDVVDAAMLGLSADAGAMILERARLAPAAGWRFPVFVGPLQDSTPAADHFSVLRSAVTAVLMQELPSTQFSLQAISQRPHILMDRQRLLELQTASSSSSSSFSSVILLFAALPDGWDAEFKLHAGGATTLQARCVNGSLASLIVTPTERKRDVVLMGCLHRPSPDALLPSAVTHEGRPALPDGDSGSLHGSVLPQLD